MTNEEYWKDFYSKNIAPNDESDFAKFVLNYLKNNQIEVKKLIDVACGNGRDTFFFASKGIDSTGVDLAFTPKNKGVKFFQGNILEFNFSPYDVVYMRFIVHTLTENDFNQLISKIKKTSKTCKFFIETRSTKDITDEEKSETYFKSSIGEEHFRMLYSQDYLLTKLQKDFNIDYCLESHGLSIYKGEDPVCIRLVLSHKS